MPTPDARGDVFWQAINFRGFGPSESALAHEGLLLGIAIPHVRGTSKDKDPKVSHDTRRWHRRLEGNVEDPKVSRYT